MALRRPTRILLLTSVLLRFGAGVLRGADATADAPTQLPEFFVPGQRVAALEIAVPRGDLRPPEPNLGPELLAIPGVYSQARAPDAMEPNIRGLGFDRVATTIDGLPLVNASPERTNSPVVILGGSAVTGMSVEKALPSVTLGPATTGGRIALNTDPGVASVSNGRPGSESGATLTDGAISALYNVTYNGARNGLTTRGRIAAQSGAWDADATFFRNDLFDYTAADGRQVAARFDDYGGSAALGWHTGTQRGRIEFLSRRLRRQETLSLPLDGRNTDSEVITFNHRWSSDSAGPLESVAWRAGYATTDPYITSEDRVSPPISAQATARSFGAGLTSIWRISSADTLAGGADFGGQSRRAIRTTAAGNDYIWPGVRYDDTGAFAEWTRAIGQSWKVRCGARADDVRSDAKDAGRLALGKPIREQYVTYNGPEAATIARHDVAGAVNVLVNWKSPTAFSAFLGAGGSVQPAQVMERYRAFLNALGGDGRGGNAVELGNPALHAERKTAVEAGSTFRSERLDVEATVYYYRIGDFILRTPIGTTEPPLTRMVVFGYRNIDARLCGGELGATLKPTANWSIPVSLATATGRNQATGAGLAEIPPVEAAAAVRYGGALRHWRVAGEFGGRFVMAKTNPAPLDNPIFADTGGFSVWHLRVGILPRPRIKFEAGVENLCNRRYTEYLTPPVAPIRPASGDLRPGDRVPAPGRSLWVSVTLGW